MVGFLVVCAVIVKPRAQVIAAAGERSAAAIAINADLVEEDVRDAVRNLNLRHPRLITLVHTERHLPTVLGPSGLWSDSPAQLRSSVSIASSWGHGQRLAQITRWYVLQEHR
jgi:hypothetical protein